MAGGTRWTNRRGRAAAALLALAGAPGCGQREAASSTGLHEEPVEPNRVILGARHDVDVLFVVDNTGTMGEEQAKLALGLASFIEVLERPEVAASYHIGVTTTDNGNPWCGSTSPEAGELRLGSCRSRPAEFTYEGVTVVEAFDATCAAVCPEEWSTIDVQPTSLDDEPGTAVRPWLERIDGTTNLPEGLTMVQALQCFVPQGIDGCGFESHLESLWKALRRSQQDDEPQHGFRRPYAALAIVIVTDEEDCSYNSDWDSIFLPEGARVFWSDPAASSPTSAVCWNAGVACQGGDCQPANLDVSGNPVSDDAADDDAVLRPLARYVEIVREEGPVEPDGSPGSSPIVAVIGGVAPDGTVTYAAASDPQYQHDFGIGPGCEGEAGAAVPPVRLRALAEAFAAEGRRSLFSACEPDYAASLAAVAEAIADQLFAGCITVPVADLDPVTPTFEPACSVFHTLPQEDAVRYVIPPCDEVDPESVRECFRFVTGDAISRECAEAGWHLEVAIERRGDPDLPEGTILVVECESPFAD